MVLILSSSPTLQEEYERVRNAYCITPQTLVTAKKHMAVLHPLPRTYVAGSDEMGLPIHQPPLC